MKNDPLNKLQKQLPSDGGAAAAAGKTASLMATFYQKPADNHDLSHSYKELKDRFGLISAELKDRNTEVQKKIAQLDTLSHYLHSILSTISQGIVFIRFNGIITSFNPAAEKILEKEGLDVLFTSFWDHFDDGLFGFSMKKALNEKKAPQNLFVSINSLDDTKELEIQSHFLFQEAGHFESTDPENIEVIEGLIITIRDYTETNRLRRIANRNDRMKELGEMAALVAHEIRNPLGGIKGFAALLERDLKDQPHLAKIAHQVVDGANHLNRLVTEVLNYTRAVEMHYEPLDVTTLLKDILQHFQAEHAESPIEFKIVEPSSPLIIAADRYMIRAAILNVVANAFEAMSTGGALTLSASEDKGVASISVTDTGVGIPTENMEKIFSPFFTTKASGNGFGLSEAHKIIQAHEGTIEVESKIGAGSRFTIRLPAKTFARNL